MGEKVSTSLGERIQLKRRERGLTQKDLAHKIGVSMASISLWEKDSSDPGARKLGLLAKELECSTLWLLTGQLSIDKGAAEPQLYQPLGDVYNLETIMDLLPESARNDIIEYAKKRLIEHIQELEAALSKIKSIGKS